MDTLNMTLLTSLMTNSDGTLVDTMPSHQESWTEACAKHGITMSDQEFYGFAGMGTGDIVRILSEKQDVHVDVEKFIKDKSAFAVAHLHEDELQPVKPVLALFMEAKKRGIKVCVASGGDKEDVELCLKRTNLYDLCDAVVTRTDVKRGKPDPETFLLAAKQIGVVPEQCIGFEDGELGMEALRAAGFNQAYDVRYWKGYPLPAALVEQFGRK
eukprot:CFRG5284T1